MEGESSPVPLGLAWGRTLVTGTGPMRVEKYQHPKVMRDGSGLKPFMEQRLLP